MKTANFSHLLAPLRRFSKITAVFLLIAISGCGGDTNQVSKAEEELTPPSTQEKEAVAQTKDGVNIFPGDTVYYHILVMPDDLESTGYDLGYIQIEEANPRNSKGRAFRPKRPFTPVKKEGSPDANPALEEALAGTETDSERDMNWIANDRLFSSKDAAQAALPAGSKVYHGWRK